MNQLHPVQLSASLIASPVSHDNEVFAAAQKAQLVQSRATKRKSLGGFESTICGIPCRIDVTYFFEQKPMGPSADSDWDCYGYTTVEFDVLDRNGRPALWLEKKMTQEDKERIEEEACQQHANRDDF